MKTLTLTFVNGRPTVYLLVYVYYDTTEIYGVFTTRTQAKAAHKKLSRAEQVYTSIDEYVLGERV